MKKFVAILAALVVLFGGAAACDHANGMAGTPSPSSSSN